jgi:hypothetical protein
MQISASRSVDDRRVLVSSPEAEADAPDGVDEGIGLPAVDLAPDPADVDIEDVGVRVKVQIPYVLEQERPRHHVAFVAHEIFQDLKLPRQEIEVASAATRPA